jgi:hypothetical protein
VFELWALKTTPTDAFADGVNVQLSEEPLQAPDQPANVLLELGVTDNETGAPIAIGSTQEAVQVSPRFAANSFTEPCPEPENVIVSRGSNANCTLAEVEASKSTLQIAPAVPLQVPPQAAKCVSRAALATNTSSPGG